MRSAKRVVTLAATVVVSTALSLGLVSATTADAAPASGNNGPAAIAGSQCEQAIKAISAKGKIRTTTEGADFACVGGNVTIEAKNDKKLVQRVVGNTRTFESRDVTGQNRAQMRKADSELGLVQGADGDSARSASTPLNTCRGPQDLDVPTSYRDDDYRAHGNVETCYGRFIVRGGRVVEVVWSAVLRYVMRQAISTISRTVHNFTVTNISTDGGPEVGILFNWNQRETVSFGSDPYVGDPEQIEILPFEVGFTQPEQYFPSQSAGKFHLTNDYITINRVDMPFTATAHPNLRMPDFDCPAANPGGQCTFS